MPSFNSLRFNQYQSGSKTDELIMFAAPAKDIATWAGIPRKGWRIRMLFQRWITESRKSELMEFWERASSPEGNQRFIMGPTAIVVAIQGTPEIADGKITIHHERIDNPDNSVAINLQLLADSLLPTVEARLTQDQQASLAEFKTQPLQESLPEIGHDYVYEFALQLTQLKHNAEWFIEENGIREDEAVELVQSLEAVSRPAVVVDGQHRLWGAAKAKQEIWLPVVALPNANWTEQIYQFIVINDKAKPIEQSQLTDIFGSSLTRREQTIIREDLQRANVEVESRIAAVIANRDPSSPFYNMVRLKVESPLPVGIKPFLSDKLVRDLINAGGGARGWRSDTDFFELFVRPTVPHESDWSNWTDGRWRPYWFTFWTTVRDYYNDQQKKEHEMSGGGSPPVPIWSETAQSNLTKGVTLKLLQNLFMEKAVKELQALDSTRDILVKALGQSAAEEKFLELLSSQAMSPNFSEFSQQVIDLLLRFIPLRVFTADWEASLDTDSGRGHLSDALEAIYERTKKNKRWQYRSFPSVFVVKKDAGI